MIKFKMFSKSPKDMSDEEAKNAKYKDTSKPGFVKPAAKVGAAVGAIRGMKKSIGRKGLVGTAINTGWGATKGAVAGAGVGALANVGSGIVGYTGKKVTGATTSAVKSVKDEVKKFSKYTDTPAKRAGLVAAGTAVGAGVGGLYGMENRFRHKTGKSITGAAFRDVKRAVKGASGAKNKMSAGVNTAKKVVNVLKGSSQARKGFKLGATVAGAAALAGGLKLTADKVRKENKEYNRELMARKSKSIFKR